jgi:hypothetical protein
VFKLTVCQSGKLPVLSVLMQVLDRPSSTAVLFRHLAWSFQHFREECVNGNVGLAIEVTVWQICIRQEHVKSDYDDNKTIIHLDEMTLCH